MGMTPTEFFESFVEGNAYDCRENPGCIRRAFNAAVSASHLADHYLKFNRRHSPDLVNEFNEIGVYVEYLTNQTNGAFKDIRSIANAYKHLYTDSNKGADVHSTVNSSGSIEAISLSGDEALSMLEEEHLRDNEKNEWVARVIFTRKDGTRSEFLPILNATIEYWRTVI